MSNSASTAQYVYKRFRVKRSDGGPTTVSLDPGLVMQACRAIGSLSTVGKIVRKAASTYDPLTSSAKNRSDHVARILEALLKEQRPALASPAPLLSFGPLCA